MEEPINEIKVKSEKEQLQSNISKVQSYLGQINAMQEFVEKEMDDDEFHDFCDECAGVTAGLRLVWKRLNTKRKQLDDGEETSIRSEA